MKLHPDEARTITDDPRPRSTRRKVIARSHWRGSRPAERIVWRAVVLLAVALAVFVAVKVIG